MGQTRRIDPTELVSLAHIAYGGSQEAFAALLGASRRTFTRWIAKQSTPSRSQLAGAARLVHPRDPALATVIASHLGETLESLGIVVPPPPAPPELPVVQVAPPPAPPEVPAAPPPPPPRFPPPEQLVDGVVCAAAEAMDLSPRAVRPAVLAAFRRAGELGVGIEHVVRALGEPPSS